VGEITFQRRVAQRRFIDRHMWDRLRLASLVYNGDTIRTTEQSEAVVLFQDEITSLSMNENTIVQVFFDNRSGMAQVDFFGGNIEAVSEAGNLVIVSGNSAIVVEGQAAMEKNEDGFVLFVSEGRASFNGTEIEEGAVLALDSYGEIIVTPIITMTSFGPSASFLSPPGAAAPIVFSWNNFFFTPDTHVIVEVAADRGFTRMVETREISAIYGNDHSSVSITLGQGNYWWRAYPVSAGSRYPVNRFFPSGALEVIPAASPVLLSPPQMAEMVFPDEARVPFSWSVVEGATAYVLEVSAYADMAVPLVYRNVAQSAVVQTGLEHGRWYWRVTPVFPRRVRGSAISSATGEFSVIRGLPVLAAPVLTYPLLDGRIRLDTGTPAGFPAPAPYTSRLMWNHDPNAASWLVELADNPAMDNPVIRQTTASNFFVLPPDALEAGQTWYWRVTALGGAEPAVSTVRSFEVSGDIPPALAVTPVEPEPAPPELVAQEPPVAPEPPAPEPAPPEIVLPEIVLPEQVLPEQVPLVLAPPPAEVDRIEPLPPIPHFPPIIFRANREDWYDSGDEIAAAIALFLEANDEYMLRIEAHANPTVNPADTAGRQREYVEELQPLSEMRARAVADRLTMLGIDPARLELAGFGGGRPVAAWEDTANWWRNRRAYFIVLE